MKSNTIKAAVLSFACRTTLILLLALGVASVQAAGLVSQLIFTTQPGGAVNGQVLGTQPVVQSADASGVTTTNGLPAHLNVTLTITAGGGTLSGTTTMDIGLAVGNGVAAYSNLVINSGGSGTVLTATAVGGQLTSATAALVHRWSFNDPQTNFTDSVNGVIANLVGGSSGLTNTGVTLLGNNYIDLAGNGTTGTTHLINNLASGTVTFEAWLTYGDTNAGQRIFDFGMSDAGQGNQGNITSGISLTATDSQNGGHPTSYVTTNGSVVSFLEDTSYLVDTNQHYWVLVYDPNTPNWQMWLDGALRSTNINNGPLPALSSLNDLNAWLGLSQSTNDAALVGIYNEFRIWDGLLGATDIASHNTNGASQKLTGSASVSFDVLTMPSVWLTSSNNITLNAGQTAVLNAASSGSTPLGYQWYFNTNTLLSGATGLSLTLSNVQAGNIGTYFILATNAAGSASSGIATLTVNLPPPAPANLVAVPGDKQVGLSWSAVSGATSYNVKQSLVNGGPYTVFTNLSGVSCVKAGLVNGTTYYYVVSAINNVGEGSNSVQASAALLTTYTNVASGNWSTSGNWSATPGAPSVGGSSSTAIVFKTTATDNSTNDLAGAFLLNQMTLAGTNTVLNAGASGSLLFTNNGVVLPLLTNTSAKTLTISAPVTLGNNLTVGVTNGGAVTIGGNITDGELSYGLTKSGLGTLTLNAINTYSGGTVINGGTVAMGSTNTFGAGTITFSGPGTLQPTYNSSGTVLTNSIVVNNGVTATFSSPSTYFYVKSQGVLSGNGTLALSGASAGSAFDFFSNPSNTFSGTLYIPAGLSLVGGFYVNSLPDSTNNIRLGDYVGSGGGTAGLFGLNSGIATPLVFNQRQIEMIGTTVGAQVVNNNTNPANIITINTPLLVSTVGAKTLTLGGTGTGTNTFAGKIANGNLGGTNSGTISLAKSGSGIWLLTGTNSYTGVTTFSFTFVVRQKGGC